MTRTSLVLSLAALCGCSGSTPENATPQPYADAGTQGDATFDPPDATALDAATPRSTVAELVQTSSGFVRGRLRDDQTLEFLGVPYAAPPTGERRFRASVAHPGWSGELTATSFGAPCRQIHDVFFHLGDEDCLTANVWTHPSGGPRPVMVFIHGGGFRAGQAAQPTYHGARLAQGGDVVVVTVQYRLGALGFLTTPSLASENAEGPGNWGLFDQIQALAWVRDNIGSFGGDPANVTIFGQSAGAFSIAALLTSPRARGLFHKAIIQSGNAELLLRQMEAQPGALAAQAYGVELSEHVGCGTNADLGCLRTADAALLTGWGEKIQTDLFGGLLPGMAPNVDGKLLPALPLDALRAGQAAEVPILLGATADESSFVTGSTPVTTVEEMKALVAKYLGSDKADEVVALYDPALFGSPKAAWMNLGSDVFVGCPTEAIADAHAAQQNPVFVYHFSHEAPEDEGDLAGLGAAHGVELPFVFGTLETLQATPSAERLALSKAVMTAWTSFAKSGVPKTTPVWPTWQTGQFLEIDATFAVSHQWRRGLCPGLRSLGVVH